MNIDGVIYCDCCGKEKLGQVRGDKLIIMDRRHGQKHVAVINIQDLLDIMVQKDNNSTKDQAAKEAVNLTTE